MKRTLFSDFLIKLGLVFVLAFLLSFVVTSLYFNRITINQQKEELKKISNFLIKEKFGNKIKNLKKELLAYGNDINKVNITTLKTSIDADFVVIFNAKKKVEKIVNFSINDLNEELYLDYVIDQDAETQIIHTIAGNRFFEGPTANKDKNVIISIFAPVGSDKDKKFVWAGYLIQNLYNYIFDEMLYLGVDIGFIAVQNNVIGFDKNEQAKSGTINEFIKQEKEYTLINEGNIKYLVIKTPFYDYKGVLSGFIVIGKRYDAIKEALNKYIISIILIFLFSSLIGVIFVTFYFKKIFSFFKRFVAALDRVTNKDFSEKMSEDYDIKELNYISQQFNTMSEQLNFYINKMEEEIKINVNEIIELNRAIRILDKQHNFDMLVETAKNFLGNSLGFNVRSLEDCFNRLNCGECNLKLFYYQAEGEKVGLCVEMLENKYGFHSDFLTLFEEVFRINCERIHNLKKKDEGYFEATLLSDILISLLKKHSVQEIFVYILEKAREYCNGDASFIGIYDSKEAKINLKFFLNIQTEDFKKLSFPSDTGLGGMIVREKRGVFIENYFDDPRIVSPFAEIVKREGLVSNIAVPIFYKNDVYGILYVSYRKQKKIIGKELQFLEKLSYAASLAIEKEMLITDTKKKEEELRNAYNEIIAKRKEINDILKSYKEANIELESINRELSEQYDVIKRSYDEINRLNKAKDTVLGILSHELNTPVTILKGYLDTLLSGKFDLQPDVLTMLNSSKKSLQTLAQLIEEMLDYVKVESGKVVIKKVPFPLINILNVIYAEVQTYLKEREITIESDVKTDILVEIDGLWFKKAILNIITNSIKFTPNGKKIKVSAALVDKDSLFFPTHVFDKPAESDKYVVIKIADEGVGIDYNELNDIFDKFYESGDIKTHSTSKHKFQAKGLGMGLSLSKQVIRLHDGVVYAESIGYDPKLCPGSAFTIVLPVGHSQIKENNVERVKKRILVVENENEIIKFLEIVFSKEYEIYIATDGAFGYKKALEINPELIMININVSKHDGYELCSMIKENGTTKKIPVILYVSGGDSIDESRANAVKANMVFSPIFDIENLKRVVNFYLKREKS